jgi:glycosyltransferase involved in cell wall biosynthesis
MRILLSAYACAPGMGSEPGVGWNWSRELGRRGHEVVVLTVRSMEHRIREELAVTAGSVPEYVFVDFAYWPKLPDGVWPRFMRYHYFCWQLAAYREALRLHKARPFDCVHHLTWGSVRLPTFMWRLGVPLIFGPLGGGEVTPKPMRRSYGLRDRIFEWLRDASNATVRLNPLMRAAFRRARLVVARTEETARLITAASKQLHVQQELAVAEVADIERARAERSIPSSPVIVFAGRLIHWKGADLALAAFARYRTRSDTGRLMICGEGPEREELQTLARKLGVSDAVDFRGKLAQNELFAVFRRSSVFLFPSLHDAGGTVVLEALANGLPVICLDCGGPKSFVNKGCGRVVPTAGRRKSEVVAALSDTLSELLASPDELARLSAQSFRRAESFELRHVVEALYAKAGFAI